MIFPPRSLALAGTSSLHAQISSNQLVHRNQRHMNMMSTLERRWSDQTKCKTHKGRNNSYCILLLQPSTKQMHHSSRQQHQVTVMAAKTKKLMALTPFWVRQPS